MKRYLFFILILATMVGCQNESKLREKSYAAQDIAVSDSVGNVDTTVTDKIIKTADMRFRVKDVQRTKEQLARAIKEQGGTIAEFSIQSTVYDSEKVRYSLDSLKEITSYRKEGMMVAKVPSDKLDDFTVIAANMAVFVDHQNLKMDDQSVTYLANQMKLKNRETAIKSIQQLAKKKADDVEASLAIGDDYVDKKIANLALNRDVKYSTITFGFYQENTVQSVVIANDRLSDYGPGFLKRVGLNIISGWWLLKELVLLLVSCLPVLLSLLAMFFAARYLFRKYKPKID